MIEKLRKIVRKGKVVLIGVIAAVSSCAMAVVASASEVPDASASGTDMENMMAEAGAQLTSQFSSLVTTIIPVILGILGSGLVIFGIFALIRFAKKIFGKVAG